MELDKYQRDNLANWNDRAGVHAQSNDYGLQRYVDDPAHISEIVVFDQPLLGDIAGCSLVHLQCHIGTDTISLARLGAQVSGLDFSEKAIETARWLAESTSASASFSVGNVYDAPGTLGRTFDYVYTGVGAINWLADINRWAAAVAALLAPGGRFYIREGHPYMWVWEEVDGEVKPTYDYWTSPDQPLSWDEAATYTDGDPNLITNTRHHEWNHSLPDVVNALVGSGMRIDRMAEHKGLDWQLVPSMVREGAQWFFAGDLRRQVPGMYSVWATKV